MRRWFLRYRAWWYKRGHRPKPGSPLFSPSLNLLCQMKDAADGMDRGLARR